MAALGFVVALVMFFHVRRHLLRAWGTGRSRGDMPPRSGRAERATRRDAGCGPASWHEAWQREWAEKFRQQAERRQNHFERHAQGWTRRWEREVRRWQRRAERNGWRLRSGFPTADPVWSVPPGSAGDTAKAAGAAAPPDDEVRRAGAPGADGEPAHAGTEASQPGEADSRAQLAFYVHLMSYLGTIAFLALVNVLTTSYPWFIWPALGWGVGVFSHYVGVFGTELFRRRWVEPVVEREVRREKAAMTTEKQASIDELSSTLAHEIRNPIAAAKSLVQQMGEDPTSLENVEYAKVALEELDRVERSIAHLLKYAREEDYRFEPVNVATVVDAALTDMRAKLDSAGIGVSRNYIGGPTIVADGEKLRRVFANIVDNAIDALSSVPDGRRLDLFIENGGAQATVRVRDNGCGIPADKIDRIFNPFFTTKDHGTGLGMAISKKIVEAHEGNIDVLSEAGRGAEFVVTLPLAR